MMPFFPASRTREWIYYILVGVFSAAYVFFTFAQPVTRLAARFDTAELNIRLAQGSVVLPMIMLWFLACYCALEFYRYAYSLRGNTGENGYLPIAYGLMILLLNLIVGTLVGIIRTYAGNRLVDHASADRMLTLVSNYSQMALYAAAFTYIYVGSRRLLKGIQKTADMGMRVVYVLFPVLLVSISYVYLIFQNPYRSSSDNPMAPPTYYVSDAMIVVTIVLPYAAIWLFGSLAAFNSWMFSRHVRGVIYRGMLHNLILGIMLIVSSTVLLQILRQFPVFFSRIGLGAVLLIVYALIGVIISGYVLIALSARRLTKIETM